jgi:rubrerythrin
MFTTKNSAVFNRHLHFRGINHVLTVDSETEVFKAYIEFAFHHTEKDVEAFENAASDSALEEQKILFLHLAWMKREVIDKLKIHRRGTSSAYNAENGRTGTSYLERKVREELRPFTTINDAFDFAWQRENRTHALYEKLGKTAQLSSVKVLFDFLLASQRHIIIYLKTQSTVALHTS